MTQPLPASGLADIDPEGPVGRRIVALAGSRPLRQVLEVRTRRRPYALTMHGEAVAEVALDDTVIAVGQERRRLRLQRVEVEVQPSWVDSLQPVVEGLRRECGLQPATLSKFEAGLMAAGLQIPGLPDLGPTAITRASSVGEIAYAVLRSDAAAMLEHEAGTRLGEDIEALHQMRVATRRMRAALDLFSAVLPVRAARLRAELGWLAAVLGEVRDLDIQLGRFDDWTEEMPGDLRSALDELADVLVLRREGARVDLLEALDSRRYERLVSGLASMLEQGPSRRSTSARQDAVVVLPTLIDECHKSAAKAAKRAKRTGIAGDFHRLRIRCKRLRYSIDFASSLYGSDTKRFSKQLARLQDELGSMQDAEVAGERLRQLAVTEEGSQLSHLTVFAMGGVAERYRIEAERLLHDLPSHVKVLRGHEWAKTEAMMARRRDERIAAQASAAAAARVASAAAAAAGRARPALPQLGAEPRRAAGEASPLAAVAPSIAESPAPEAPATEGAGERATSVTALDGAGRRAAAGPRGAGAPAGVAAAAPAVGVPLADPAERRPATTPEGPSAGRGTGAAGGAALPASPSSAPAPPPKVAGASSADAGTITPIRPRSTPG